MPTRNSLSISQFTAQSFRLFDEQWFVLTSGDYAKDHFNSMTISWGSLGTIWDKPFAQVVVRPTRYTFKFINEYDTFTLCGFGEEHRSAMNLIGSKSGRVCDKIKESGLTVVPSQVVAAPCFAEAQLVLECRKIYWQDFDPTHFLSPDIPTKYPQKDYHRVFFGEVLAIFGTPKFTTR